MPGSPRLAAFRTRPVPTPVNNLRQASALIERIQTHYHEGHRRALPELQAMAAAVEALGLGEDLVDELSRIGNALEQHMFKEEMRLFPMMEQGGNTLIGRLIEDLHRDHVDHEAAMQDFQARLRRLGATDRPDPALRRLIDGVDALAHALAQHIRAEEHELFPLFSPRTGAATSAALALQPPAPTTP